MGFWLALICIAGLLADVWFIRTEYAGDMAKATLLKGIASAFFVLLGLVCFLKVRTPAGQLIFIGLILGLFGDVFLNLRNQFEGTKSRAVFAVGILAFLSGHFLYIAALIRQSASILLLSAILTAVLSVAAIPPLMKRITAPSTMTASYLSLSAIFLATRGSSKAPGTQATSMSSSSTS